MAKLTKTEAEVLNLIRENRVSSSVYQYERRYVADGTRSVTRTVNALIAKNAVDATYHSGGSVSFSVNQEPAA
jgi:hypothetical protein